MGQKSEFVPVRIELSLDLLPLGEIIFVPDKHLKIYKTSLAQIEKLEEYWRSRRMGDYSRGYLNGQRNNCNPIGPPSTRKEWEDAMAVAEAAEPRVSVARKPRTARRKKKYPVKTEHNERLEQIAITAVNVVEEEVGR
ncbi:hypothetical protein V3F56_02855 [Moorellaceae bacterium AZ2]